MSDAMELERVTMVLQVLVVLVGGFGVVGGGSPLPSKRILLNRYLFTGEM
jgi:hypothetical protein